MRAVFIIGLCLSWLSSNGQTTLLPNWLTDSLIYETKLGRQCEQVRISKAREIKSMGEELLANGAVIKLLEGKVNAFDQMVFNLQEQIVIVHKLYDTKIKVFKRKIKRLFVVIIGQAVVIVLLVL